LRFVMLNVIMLRRWDECHYFQCRYIECHRVIIFSTSLA
jgi:hypothetical protein